jgi:hypothetical protein
VGREERSRSRHVIANSGRIAAGDSRKDRASDSGLSSPDLYVNRYETCP